MGIELGCAAGDVQCGECASTKYGKDLLDRLARHHLFALRSGVDMAMEARLIALVAEIDLQRVGAPPGDGREIGGPKKGEGSVHLRLQANIVDSYATEPFPERNRLTATGISASTPSRPRASRTLVDSNPCSESMLPSASPRFAKTNDPGMTPMKVASI